MSRSRRCILLIAAAALALPATAGAATPAASGTSVLTLQGAAARALSAQGVTISAVAPAKAKGTRITFPVATASVGTAATLSHRGALRLRAGARRVTLAAPQVRLAASSSRLRARIGSATTTLLTVDAAKRRLNAAAGTVGLRGATVRLTSAGAAALRRALHLRRLAPGVLGTLTVDAKRDASGGGEGGGTGTGGTPGTGTTTPAGPTVPSGPSTPTDPGPTPLARPATAVDVSAAAIGWHVRDSFIQYINTGEGAAVSGGATADPPTVRPGSPEALVYDFRFPFKAGWYDPVSGSARLTYGGTITFSYDDHGIMLTATDPEVEIAGGASRAIFMTGNTGEAPRRGVLVKLDPSHAAAITHSPDGTSHSWSQVPGSVPADAGASVFAGFYAGGAPFGWIGVDATTP